MRCRRRWVAPVCFPEQRETEMRVPIEPMDNEVSPDDDPLKRPMDEPRDLDQPMATRLQPWPARGKKAAIYVCVNRRNPDVAVSCQPRGGSEVAAAVEAGVAERGLNINFREAYCLNACMHGPNIRIIPSNTRFYGVRVADVPEVLDIVEKHLAERPEKKRPGLAGLPTAESND